MSIHVGIYGGDVCRGGRCASTHWWACVQDVRACVHVCILSLRGGGSAGGSVVAKGCKKGGSGGEGTHTWGALSPPSSTLGRRHAAAASIAVQEGGVHRRLALSLQFNINPTSTVHQVPILHQVPASTSIQASKLSACGGIVGTGHINSQGTDPGDAIGEIRPGRTDLGFGHWHWHYVSAGRQGATQKQPTASFAESKEVVASIRH